MMRRALELAERGRGTVRPNPMVGCVIARGGKIVAEGWHERPGGDHAEVAALRKAGARAKGATLYVTLEPCNHHGRTGPCSEAVIAAGVKRVIFAMGDPNPRVDGKGGDRLRAAGVEAYEGLLDEEAYALNRAWVKWITTGVPWVTLKAAVSLDGRIATRSGDSQWLSGQQSRGYAHVLRARHDAILVGAGTMIADDPQLTVRVKGYGPDPQRVVLDGKLRTPPRSRALPGAWVLTGSAGGEALRKRGAEVIRVGKSPRLAPRAVLAALGKRNMTSVLIEGGGDVHGQFLDAGVVDEVALFMVGRLIGGDGVPLLAGPGARTMKDAWHLEDMVLTDIEDDVLWVGRPVRGPKKPRG